LGQLRRILLAEDNPDDAELTMLALRQNGLANEVVLVRDGTEVVDYFSRKGPLVHPAVVLLDLKMPKMDGLEVLRWMRSNDASRTVPVVMLTSSREERDLVESYRLGVNAYVVKPVVFEHFVNAVRQLGLFWAVVNEPPPETA
jgi:DNA-binding response OmpR family regulator